MGEEICRSVKEENRGVVWSTKRGVEADGVNPGIAEAGHLKTGGCLCPVFSPSRLVPRSKSTN